MASEDYPVTGLAVDTSQASSAFAVLDQLEAKFASVGAAARASSESIKQVTTATPSAAVTTGGAAAVTDARSSAAAVTGAWEASDRARAVSRAQLLAINRNLAGSEVAAAAAAAAEQQSIEETLAQFRLAVQLQRARSTAAAAASETAANQAALAAQIADEAAAAANAESVEAHLAAFRADVQAQAVRGARAAAEQTAAAAAASAAEQESIEAHLAAFRTDVQVQSARAAQEAAAAAVEAAELEVAAREQAVVATAANAEAAVKEAQAQVRSALAAGVNKEAVQAQSAAYLELAASLTAAKAAREALAAQNAEAKGLDVAQAVASIGAQTEAAAAVAVRGAKQVEGAIEGVGVSAVTVREGFVIIREAIRGDFTRMAGSASILTQSIGGVGLVLKAIPFLAVGAAIAGVAYEMAKGSDEAAKLNNALAVTNNYAGLTAESFDRLATSVAGNTNTAIGKVNETLLSLVAGGKLTGDSLAYVTDASARLAELTGQDATKVAANFARYFDDPAKGAQELTNQYHFLSAAEYEHIQRLQEQGDKQAALSQLFSDFDGHLKSQAANLGILETAWKSLATGISTALQALRDYGKGQSTQDQIDTLRARIKTEKSAPGGQVGSVNSAYTTPYGATVIGVQKNTLAADQAQLDQLVAKQAADAKATANAKIQTDAINGTALQAGLNAVKSNQQKADDAYAAYARDLSNRRAALAVTPKTDPGYADLAKQVAEGDANAAAVKAQYQKQYAGGRPDRGAARAASQSASAQKGVDDVASAVTALNQELDAAANPDLSPLADGAAKIGKAYRDALAKYTDTTNGFKQAQALATSAAEKERLTLLLQLADAENKAARAEQVKLQALQAEGAANDNAARAIDAYYQAGGQGADAYAAALQNQAQATLDGKNRQDELAIAQKYGVTSINDIAAAEERYHGASAERAQQIQDEARRHYELAAAVNAETDAVKARQNVTAGHSAALATIDDLQKEAEAYEGGTAAIAAYERQKAIVAGLVGKVAANATPEQRAAITTGVTKDIDDQAGAAAVANQQKLNFAVAEQARLATLTTEQRQIDAQIQQRISDLVKANNGVYEDQFATIARTEALQRKQIEDTAKLKTGIQDSVRSGFIDTGELDFSSLKDGVEKAMRQALYDSLLAQPINVVINATVDLEKQALNSLLGGQNGLGSLFGGGGGGLGGLLGGGNAASGGFSLIDKLFGTGTGGGAYASDPGLDSALRGLGGDLAKSATNSIVGGLGKALGGAGIGSVTGNLATSIFGLNNNAGSQVGGAIGGLIGGLTPLGPLGAAIGGALGSVLGSLLGGKPTNAAAVLTLDGSGNITSTGGSKRTAETTAAATSVANAVGQIETALRGAGAKLNTTVSSIDLGVRDTTHIILSNGQRVETAVGDTTAAVKGAATAILQGAVFSNKQLQSVVSSMVAAGASIDDVTKKIDEFNSAQSFTSGLQTAGLQYTDPLAYQLAQLQTAQAARQTQFDTYKADGVLDPTQVDSLQAALTSLNGAEIKDAISKYSSSVTAAAHSTQDYVDAQKKLTDFVTGLRGGSLTDLSPTDQLAVNQTAYQDQLKKAQGGDFDALSNVTSSAQTYLEGAQKYFGSGSAYSAIFDQVTSQLTALGTGTLGATDTTSQDIAKATTDLTAAIGAGAQSIVDAIRAAGYTVTTPAGATSTGGAANDNSTVVSAVNSLNDTLIAVGGGIVQTTAAGAAATVQATTGAAAVQTALNGGLLTNFRLAKVSVTG